MVNPLILKAAPYALVAMTALSWRACDVQRQREIGAMRERLQVADSLHAVAQRQRDSLAAAYRVDTVRLTRTLVRRDTVLATVDRFLRDTVPVPVEVVREIVRTDGEVIQACQIALGTCNERTRNAERRAALFEQERDAYWRQMPGWGTKARQTITAALIGAGITYLVIRP